MNLGFDAINCPNKPRFVLNHFVFRYAFDEAWGYNHGFVVGETGVTCDWSAVEKDDDMPNCIKGICGGHKALDILPFDIKVNEGVFGEGGETV